MVSTIVIRLLLVAVVIGAAHWIKPFSVKNITQHLLYSSRSFAFVLPEQARVGFNQANDLALNLSGSLFEDEWGASGVEGLMLAAQSQADSPRPVLKVWPPYESGRPMRKAKPGPKRSAPARRIERGDRNDVATLAVPVESADEAEETDELATAPAEAEHDAAATPVALPAAHPPVTGIHTLSVGFLFTTEPGEKAGCPESEVKLLKLGASVQVLKRPRIILLRAERPKTVAPECEGEKPDSNSTPVEFEVEAEMEPEPAEERPEPETPREPESAPAEGQPSPLKCPTEPEG
jgi:hypothetical protein